MIARSTCLALLLAACGSAARIPLDEVRDDAYGYAIRVPTGATQTEKETWRHVWSWSPDQHINSYTCIVERSELTELTVEAARARVASVRAPGEIEKVAPLGTDGVVVQLAEDDLVHYAEVWTFRRGKTRTMAAICTGPAKGDTVRSMSTSLRVID